MGKRILEIGCGKKPYVEKEGEKVIHLDIVKLPHVEVLCDLNKFPYPFKDNVFDEIIATHVLEHLDDLLKVMEELHRILKSGGIIKIRVPYFADFGAYTDFSHKHFFTSQSFDFFDESTKLGKEFVSRTTARFKILIKELRFPRGIKLKVRNSFIFKLYEKILSKFIPAFEIYFELKKV